MGELTRSITTAITFEESERLVERLKERDEAAFAEAFQLYKDLVYTLCVKLLADRGEAMDVTQEVFLTLFQKIHQFRGECSLKTWLYRITLNQAANRNRWWRRRLFGRTESLSLNLDSHASSRVEPISEAPTPERVVFSSEFKRALEKSLRALPFEQRAAVTLRDVHELSYEEIADVTGVQVGTVKSRIARGRERLRELLKSYQEAEAR